jgi:hypothetical protein
MKPPSNKRRKNQEDLFVEFAAAAIFHEVKELVADPALFFGSVDDYFLIV